MSEAGRKLKDKKMKKNIKAFCLSAMTGIGLVAASSANAAINVTFDAADSNIATGHYDFNLTGLTTVPTLTSSTFELSNFPNIGNTQNPLGIVSSPSGWSPLFDLSYLTEWNFNNASGAYNGAFDITATPNLHGIVDWNLAISGGPSGNGTVNIGAVPEASTTGIFMGFGALAPASLVFLKRRMAAQV